MSENKSDAFRERVAALARKFDVDPGNDQIANQDVSLTLRTLLAVCERMTKPPFIA